MANTQDSNKIVRASALQAALQQIFNWMPFKKNKNNGIQLGKSIKPDEGTLLGVGDGEKNTFEVRAGGQIFILKEDKFTQESVQDIISKRESIVINNAEEWKTYSTSVLNVKNLGKIVYITKNILNELDEVQYLAGIYMVSLLEEDSSKAILAKLGITSSVTEDIGTQVAKHEESINNLNTEVTNINNKLIKYQDHEPIPTEKIDAIN